MLTRWASLLAGRISLSAELCRTLICIIMQIRILAGRVLLAGLISKSGTSRPGPVAGRAGASGWASATSWASESEPETCIFFLS